MKWTGWIVIARASILEGCQTTAGGCAGWTKPPPANDPPALTEREERLARWVISTDRFGRSRGCWK
jgi:hypothetical protein